MAKKAFLCVDDELDILDNICALLLEEFGGQYEIEKAESAEEALEVIDELVDDGVNVIILISDWLMPGLKGDTFLVQVHEKYPDMVKILLTGQADEGAVNNAWKNASLFAYIKKPWNNEEFIRIVRKGLNSI